jgi:hypothetical protein
MWRAGIGGLLVGVGVTLGTNSQKYSIPARTAACPDDASRRMECPEQARSVLSASTKRPSGSRPGAATVDTAASRAGARARLAAGGAVTFF